MKKLEAITLALLLGAAYKRGRKAGMFEGELTAAKRSKKKSEKTSIDWDAIGSIASTVSEKIEKYFESNPKTADTPVEETENENPVAETEKEEAPVKETEKEDPEDHAIDSHLMCTKPAGPFERDELYETVVKNGKPYVLYGHKEYRVFELDQFTFVTKNGAQFV